MESIARGLVVYFVLLIVFRLSGKRTLAQSTSFDFVLLLIISEVTQQAMVDDDHSVTNAVLLILTLVGTSIVLSWLKQRFPSLDRVLEGQPLLIVDNGKLLHASMQRERIDENDVLEAARALHGLERLEQIKYAVVERNGEISIVPVESAK